jgi:hypothetical protein
LPRLFDRLFSTKPVTAPALERIDVDLYEGDATLEVVGESYRQDVLWDIVGGECDEPVRHHTVAILLPEPTNTYDENAIMVLIRGQLVGYLSRADAAAYLPGLLRLIDSCETGIVALNATIVGGGEQADGRGRLGVFLDHDPRDFGLV